VYFKNKKHIQKTDRLSSLSEKNDVRLSVSILKTDRLSTLCILKIKNTYKKLIG